MADEVGVLSYVLIGIFLVLSAFFSGSEAALLSVQRVRIRHMASHGIAGASRVARMIDRPGQLLPPILLGNNLVNTAAAAVSTSIALTLIEDAGRAVLAATAAVTVVLLVFGETIPKTVATRRAERFAIAVSLPIQLISVLLRPVSIVLERLADSVARLFGGTTERESLITEEEIKMVVSMGGEVGAVEPGEADMIRRLLELGERRASEVMTPRPEIVWVDQGTSVRDFLGVYGEHSHTRFPVRGTGGGDVVGLVSVKDVLRQVAAGAAFETPATNLLHEPFFVPETKPGYELLQEMQAGGHQVALIADEFGELAGLVTLKRLVEGIVGPTAGTDEPADQDFVAIGEDDFDVDAGMSIADANDRMDLALPAGDYETVAGLVMDRLGRIPEAGDVVVLGTRRLQVAEMRGLRVVRVTVTRTLQSAD
jgi:putative hemolysin